MPGAVAGTAALLLLALTGLAVTATLRVRSVVELVLGAYVVAFAEVVVLVLVLSPVGGVRRSALLAGLTLLCLLAVGVWEWQGRPRPPLPDPRHRAYAELRRPVLLALGTAVGLACVYAVTLIVATPPVTWDSLRYHLMRAAMWRQDGAVGYVADTYDDRLNANPPNGEIALTFALELTRHERFAGFVQLFAWLACGVAIVALARRLRLAPSEALFGAFLFLLLPIVVLQSSTTQNDLVVASLLLASTVFFMRDEWSVIGLGGVALALAVGTKVTAIFALPVILVVALLTDAHAGRARRLVGLVTGALLGSYWYAVNLAKTGDPLGETPDRGYVQLFEPVDNASAALARMLDAIELTGWRDWGKPAYVAAMGAFIAALVVLACLRRISLRHAIVASLVALVPFVLLPISFVTWRAFAKVHDALGSPPGLVQHDLGATLLPFGGWQAQTVADEAASWFGPVGFVLVLGLGVTAVVLVRRGGLPTVALAVGLAPLAWLVALSATLGYDPWQGRFFMYSVALSAGLWGLLLRRPPIAWTAAAVSVTVAALTFVQYDQKPLATWPGLERWELQTIHRPGVAATFELLEERIPDDAVVALALVSNDWGYPAFGPRLTRRVVLVSTGADAAETEAQWLIVNRERSGEVDRACWETVLEGAEGQIFTRRPSCRSAGAGS